MQKTQASKAAAQILFMTQYLHMLAGKKPFWDQSMLAGIAEKRARFAWPFDAIILLDAHGVIEARRVAGI